jgi:hypothetical protein
MLHHPPGLVAGSEDIEVPDCLLPASITARHFQIFDPRSISEMLQQGLDELICVSQQKALCMSFEVFDGATKARGGFFAQAWELFDLTSVECRSKRGHRGNPQPVI